MSDSTLKTNSDYGIDLLKIATNGYEIISIQLDIIRDLIDPSISEKDALYIINLFLDKKNDKGEKEFTSLVSKYPILFDTEEVARIGKEMALRMSENEKYNTLLKELSTNTVDLVNGLIKT